MRTVEFNQLLFWWLASLAAASYYPRQSPSRTPACFKCNRTVIKSLSSTAPTKYRGYATNQPRRRTNSHTNQPTHRLLLVGVSCIKWRVYTIALFVCSLTVQIKYIASGEDNKLPKEITFALYPPGRSPTQAPHIPYALMIPSSITSFLHSLLLS